MKRKFLLLLILMLIMGAMLVACGQPTPKQVSSAPTLAPANPLPKMQKASGEKAGGEGGGGGAEAPRGPTLINPGGLPPAPQASNSMMLAHLGQERMVKVKDTKGQFSILFVDSWKQGSGSTPGSLRSSQKDWYAEAEAINAKGKTPLQAAQALNASHANGIAGYKELALQQGNIHALPAVSLIYQYEARTNPVTGKPLRFVASQVFIGGGPANKLGHVTFIAPYAYYGDLSEIFDKVLAGFSWK